MHLTPHPITHKRSHTDIYTDVPYPRAHTRVHAYIHTHTVRPLLLSGRKRRGRGVEAGKKGGRMGVQGGAGTEALFPLTRGCCPSVPGQNSELGPGMVQSEPRKSGKSGDFASRRRALSEDPDSDCGRPCSRLLLPGPSPCPICLTSAPPPRVCCFFL